MGKYNILLDKMGKDAKDLNIEFIMTDEVSYSMPACACPRKRAIIIPKHYISDTEESAIMIGHEMAHIVHHDQTTFCDYSNSLCEENASIGGLYYVVGNYMDIYHIDKVNSKSVEDFMNKFNINDDYLYYYVQKIGNQHLRHEFKPTKTIELLYKMVKTDNLDQDRFENFKRMLITH